MSFLFSVRRCLFYILYFVGTLRMSYCTADWLFYDDANCYFFLSIRNNNFNNLKLMQLIFDAGIIFTRVLTHEKNTILVY